MHTPGLKDYLHLHFIVLIWGFTAIVGKLITMPAQELVMWRTGISAIALFLIIRAGKEKLNESPRNRAVLMVSGILLGLHWITFFAAARIANVSTCLAGMATCSLWTSILDPLVTRRKLLWMEVLLGMVVLVGLGLVAYFQFNHLAGLLVAVASAMFDALFTVFNAGFAKKHNSRHITFYQMCGCCLFIALMLPLYTTLFEGGRGIAVIPSGTDWAGLLFLSLVCTVYAYAASVRLMKKFTPFAMNLVVNLEPVYGVVLAYLVFKGAERMTEGFYIGTALIILAVFSYPVITYIKKVRQVKQQVLV